MMVAASEVAAVKSRGLHCWVGLSVELEQQEEPLWLARQELLLMTPQKHGLREQLEAQY